MSFDWKFYTSFYPDLSIFKDEKSALNHYKKYGKKEGRLCYPPDRVYNQYNQYEERLKKVNDEIENEAKMYISSQKPENKISILIRTCMRPNFFKKCIDSILSQEYSNYCIHIAYDRNESYEYIEPLTKQYPNKIFAYYINKDNISKEKYRFNLYCNDLMDIVKDGYIMFLDDDDMLSHSHVLQMINDHIVDEKSIILWKFSRPDMEIFPFRAPYVRLGEIDTSCVCFHSSFKKLGRWPDKQCGDFGFYSMLMKNTIDKGVKYIPIRSILTKTIYTDRVANFGKIGE